MTDDLGLPAGGGSHLGSLGSSVQASGLAQGRGWAGTSWAHSEPGCPVMHYSGSTSRSDPHPLPEGSHGKIVCWGREEQDSPGRSTGDKGWSWTGIWPLPHKAGPHTHSLGRVGREGVTPGGCWTLRSGGGGVGWEVTWPADRTALAQWSVALQAVELWAGGLLAVHGPRLQGRHQAGQGRWKSSD